MGTPVQIGSFCADFAIRDPPVVDYPGVNDGAYYRRIDPTTNKMYYLAIDNSNTMIEVENPMESTNLTINDFKLKLNWNRTLLPVLESGTLTPTTELRYLSSVNKPDYGSSSMVKISPVGEYYPTEITVRAQSSTTVPNASAITLRQFSNVTGNNTLLKYTKTADPPTKVTRGNALVFLVDDDDDNNTVVTSDTTKRYLIVNPTNATAATPPIVGFINLYEPRVTEAMVRQTLYRINRKESLANSLDITYSIDVFRESVTGSTPTITSTINYREINLDDRTGVAIGTVVDPDGSFAGTQVTHDSRTYVVTKQIQDKSISELYGELSLGLFKKFPLQVNSTNDLYLGYDCATPSASCASGSPTLVLRQYHNFLNPVNSAQFRMYNLGNREYMILVTEPLTTPPRRLMMKPDSTGALRFTNVTAIKEERGWHLEDAGVDSKVRLRWNYPGSPVAGAGNSAAIIAANYLQISEGTNPSPTMVVQGSATIFVCIKCTHIDEQTGTCATKTSILIDEDMNFLSSPTWSTPVSIDNQAHTSVVNQDLKFQRGSDSLMMRVSDDGDVSFDPPVSSSSFFTTSTGGIMTIEQRRAGVVFIGRTDTTPTGEYLYAKYTDGTMEFVAATNPNVGDGFGWIVDVPNSSIRWVSPTRSPVSAASPVIPLNSQITKIITTFSASLGAYDAQNDRYQLNFTMAHPRATFLSITGTGLINLNYSADRRSAAASIDATLPPGSSPTNCVSGSPSPSVTRQTTRSVTISATINGAPNDTVTVTVPEGPCPTIDSLPSGSPIPTTTTTAIFNGFNVSNMDSNGPVTVQLRPTGSPGSAAPEFTHQQVITYGTGNFTLTGLSVNTRYAAPRFSFMNSRSRKSVGVTLLNGFQTISGPSIGSVSVDGAASTLTYNVINGTLPVAPTIRYKSAGSPNTTAPAGGSWTNVGDGTVSTTAPSTAGGSVTVSIVPGSTTTYNYFFQVDGVTGTGFITVQSSTLPAPSSIKKRFVGSLTSTAPSDTSTGTTAIGGSLPIVNSANSQLQIVTGGRFNVLSFSTDKGMRTNIPVSTSRKQLTICVVFRLNRTDGFRTIFQGNQWVTGSLHVNVDEGKLMVSIHDSGWSNHDWKYPFSGIVANTRYTLIISIDAAARSVVARLNGSKQTNTFSASGLNLLSGDTSICIGSADDGGRRFDGNIGEFIMYDNVALNDSQAVQFENYVTSRYVDALSSPVSPVGPFTIDGQVTISALQSISITFRNGSGSSYISFLNDRTSNDRGTVSGTNRITLTDLPEFAVGKVLRFNSLTGGANKVAKITARFPTYLEVTFYTLSSPYSFLNEPAGFTNTTSSQVDHGTTAPGTIP